MSRLGLYPRGMAADRALRLALGALGGAHTLDPDETRRRVAGPYPESAALPDPPELDALPPRRRQRAAVEVGPARRASCLPLSATQLPHDRLVHELHAREPRRSPRRRGGSPGMRRHRRIRRTIAACPEEPGVPRPYGVAPLAGGRQRVLASAFPVDARSADELLTRHMQAAAREAGADWRTVLRADREPRGDPDWATLLRLVGHRALSRVRAGLAAAPRAVLLTNLGLPAPTTT